MPTTTCSSCGAPIEWAITATKGKPIPLDAAPVADGNIVTEYDGIAGKLVARFLRKGDPEPAASQRRVAHFATCPNSKRHRK